MDKRIIKNPGRGSQELFQIFVFLENLAENPCILIENRIK
nr:MAG TPA: hypothetical protein [Caudoviricetes sp.]